MCRTYLVQFLICAHLLFGLLLFRNLSSHQKQVTLDYQPAWYPSSASEDIANSGHVKGQMLQGGVLSQIRSSLNWGARASMTSEKEGTLCDFRRDEGLPKQVLLQKLVECYNEIITNGKTSELDHKNMIGTNFTHSNRRLLREITNTYSKNALVKNINAAPFHLDYSGPQTHPPKNN